MTETPFDTSVVDALRSELAATESALREVCEKISIGEAMVLPDGGRNSCDIFHSLLVMHGLWREPTGAKS